MHRLAASVLAPIVVVLAGCATPPPRPEMVLPPGCVGTAAPDYTIRVDASGQATPECLGVFSETTTLNWEPPADTRRLLVIFRKQTPPAPRDPRCTGRACTLDRKLNRIDGASEQTFKYSVVLVRDDGTVVLVDPMLIIKP